MKQVLFLVVLLGVGWLVSKPLPEGELNFGGGFLLSPTLARIIETFGFVTGGVMNITVNNFAVLFTLKEKAEQELGVLTSELEQDALKRPSRRLEREVRK